MRFTFLNYLENEQGENIESRIFSLVDKLEIDKVCDEQEWFMTGECQ